jgi:hypothetical protein
VVRNGIEFFTFLRSHMHSIVQYSILMVKKIDSDILTNSHILRHTERKEKGGLCYAAYLYVCSPRRSLSGWADFVFD